MNTFKVLVQVSAMLALVVGAMVMGGVVGLYLLDALIHNFVNTALKVILVVAIMFFLYGLALMSTDQKGKRKK